MSLLTRGGPFSREGPLSRELMYPMESISRVVHLAERTYLAESEFAAAWRGRREGVEHEHRSKTKTEKTTKNDVQNERRTAVWLCCRSQIG